MGSLMAGWSSPIIDQHKAMALARRNKSLTKEEIDQFWKSQNKTGDEKENTSLSSSPNGSPNKSPRDNWFTTDQSAPNSPHGDGGDALVEEEETTRTPDKTGDWWTKSNLAFLNEPPRDEIKGAAHKYTPQFDVARLSTGTA